MELNVLDLFSGIGGFSVGLEATGKFKTIGFCEQDKFCQKVLHKHWPNIPIHEDIKKLDGTKIKADVLVGGFPCQSFSIAGKQKGKDDERYLWDEMFRVIKEVQPRWIIGENVQNLINIADGQILQGIHNDLEAENYEVQTFCISAASIGAWHKRSRVWIVAANTNSRLRRGRGAEFKSRKNEVREFHFKEEKQSEQHIRSKIIGHNVISGETKDWWQTFSKLYRIPHGIQYGLDKDRANRIKALGNSIVPQIVTEIGKAIIKAEEENV